MKVASFVKENTSTTGTGALTLDGAVAGFRTFSAALSLGDYVPYFVISEDGSVWERGVGQLTTPTTLSREVVLESSSGTALATLPVGTHTVGVFEQPSLISDDRGLRINSSSISVAIPPGGNSYVQWDQIYSDSDSAYTALSDTIYIPEWVDSFLVTSTVSVRGSDPAITVNGTAYVILLGANCEPTWWAARGTFGESGDYYGYSATMCPISGLFRRIPGQTGVTVKLRVFNGADSDVHWGASNLSIVYLS